MQIGPERARATVTEEMTDESIVARVRSGDIASFEILMRRHNQRVYRAARAILGSDDEAEDVMQEAYVNAYAHLAQFEGRSRFSTWLTRITVHEALARKRRGKRFESTDPSALENTPMPTQDRPRSPEQGASDSELARMLEQAIDGLPEAFRAVFVLRTVEGMSVAETAESLDIPEETVKTRLFRSRGLLKQALLSRADAAAPQAFGFHLSRCDAVVARVLARIAKR
jgi:RNA polymerase sigma-70 factor (ECF subfamily)